MEPFLVAKACAAAIYICGRVSSVLNIISEHGRNSEDLTRQPLKEMQSVIRVLDSVQTALARFPEGEPPWEAISPNYALGSTMKGAVNGCSAAALRLSEVLGPIQLESKPSRATRKDLADSMLGERSGEVLQIHHQIQTHTGVLKMGLRTMELSLLLQFEPVAGSITKELLAKIARLRRSIHGAERILSYPIKDDNLEESGTKYLNSCARYARSVLRSADTLLEQGCNSISPSSERDKTKSESHWGFTFLDSVEICEESNLGDRPVDVAPVDSRARIEAWITRPTPSDLIEADLKSLPPTALEPPKVATSGPSDLPYLDVCEDDNISEGNSDDSLNLDAGLARIFVHMGDECFAEESMVQAEIYYRKALDRVETSSTGLDRRLIEQKIGMIGVTFLEQGKYDAADVFFNKYPDLAGPVVEKIFAKGRSFYNGGRYRYAANCFRRALNNPSRLPRDTIREVSMLAGLSSLALDELDEAHDRFLMVLNSNDNIDDSRALEAKHHLAIVAMKRGDLDQALSYCQKASDGRFRLLGQDHADSQTSLALLAEIYEARGDSAEVDGHLKLLTPENSRVALTRTRSRRLKRRLEELQDGDRASQSANCIIPEKQLDDFLDRVASRADQPLEPEEQDTQCLIAAVQDGELIILRSLLRLPDFDAARPDSLGQTALHHAVHKNDKQVMEILVQYMTKGFNVTNTDGDTALILAIRNRAEAMVLQLLRSKQVNVNLEYRKEDQPKAQSNSPALHMAIKLNNESAVAMLLQSLGRSNLKTNFRDMHGKCPIHYALCGANGNITEMLLACPDINVNSVTEPEKQTPLSLAIINGQYQAASTLIARRDVDVNRRDFQGNSALHHAAWRNEPQIMAHLLKRKSLNVNARDLSGRTALHIAAVYSNIALVKLLAAHKDIDMKAENKYGKTPLQAALSANQTAVVTFLNKMECDLYIRDKLQECGILDTTI